MNTNEATVPETQIEESEVVVPSSAGLSQLVNLMRPYSTKGQQPFIDRRNTGQGHFTGRVHICYGCESLATDTGGRSDRTLRRLFSDDTPTDRMTKRQRKSSGKPRIGRQYTLYTHESCREESYRKAQAFIQSQIQGALSDRAKEEGVVA